MDLTALPAFTDNYIWMFHDGRQAVVVDPGEAAPVLAALDANRLTLAAILVTHHHGDHVGGIEDLRSRLTGPVYGPARERIPAPYTALVDGDSVRLLGAQFQVIDVPGHTGGHIAYFSPASAGRSPLLFCGDTLFSGGCGRLFEGTPQQMHDSLTRLAALPGDTRVCCAHEYTLSNLKFARVVEPSSRALIDYQDWCLGQRASGLPTLPSTIERERRINPFLRCAQPEVAGSAQDHGARSDAPVEVLAALRQWKNEFR
jgi:hydroxyacylglutathione hydrolase